MGNDDSDVGLVQLGYWAIGRSALEEPGAGWEETVAGRFPEEGLLPPRAREDFPLSEPEISVVLTNDSAGRWIPTEEDHCHVQGIVFDDQGARIGSGWYAHKQAAQLPALDPGQRAVLPAFLNNPELVGLTSGSYQILATLTALDLRTATRGSLTFL